MYVEGGPEASLYVKSGDDGHESHTLEEVEQLDANFPIRTCSGSRSGRSPQRDRLVTRMT